LSRSVAWIGEMTFRPNLAMLLSLNGGFVDTAGFLLLQGLFTAHVTGNFVTLCAALSNPTSDAGVAAKLLALPVFCLCVMLARALHYRLEARGLPILRCILALETMLLIIAAILSAWFTPLPKGDSLALLAIGMTLVAAMAVQNAAARTHLASFPATTLMTSTTTQLMLDLTDLLRGPSPQDAPRLKQGLRRFLDSGLGFLLGCALGGLAEHLLGGWSLVVPPGLLLLAQRLVPPEPA
jgi:uncharacterized membrane protein YoaK (UPF0700 family)